MTTKGSILSLTFDSENTFSLKYNLDFPIKIYKKLSFKPLNEDLPPSYGLDKPNKESISSVKNGQRYNCDKITFIPHVHTTHLESCKHIEVLDDSLDNYLANLQKPMLCKILDIASTEKGEFGSNFDHLIQLVILAKKEPKYKGFEGFPIPLLNIIENRFSAVTILGCNEPSFDPEQDNGAMEFHRNFFKDPSKKLGRFLLELLDLSDPGLEVDQVYIVHLNPLIIDDTDAFPCSPVLYKPLE